MTPPLEITTEMCRIGRLMYEKGFISSSEGNISYRLDAETVLITPSGLHKGFLEPGNIIAVDFAGNRVDEPTELNAALRPTSELPMHLTAYQQRPDIRAVVHAHPHHAIVLSIAGIPIADDIIPEVVVFLGRIPVTPYATPSSTENADAIRDVITDYDALVLQRHGSLTVGNSLMEAFMRLETVENSAKIAYMLAMLDASERLPPDQLAKLHIQRESLLARGKM